ncbi:unnamed protein product [Orchesella dallaii]|uniref:C2H2-type domain-containing protein n=1 Tax=Orchesella dallaii TaxID=48710 RepID=A0ABP1QDK6_9HEXA
MEVPQVVVKPCSVLLERVTPLKNNSNNSDSPKPTRKSLETYPQTINRECLFCNKNLHIVSNLYTHLRRHLGERPNTCSKCELEFSTKTGLNSHKTVHGERVFTCDECPASFRNRNALLNHTRCVHLKERRYKCNICSSTFGEARTLKSHIKSHLNEKHYQCDKCKKRFSSKQGLDFHRRQHATRGNYPCSKCKRIFINEEGVKSHFLRKHGKPEERPFPCLFCEERWCTNKDLEQHLRVNHIQEAPYICEVCGEEFATAQRLKYHRQKHPSIAKKFKCLECSKEFEWQASLACHKRFFHRQEKLTCHICFKQLANLSNLNRHVKGH